VISVARWTSIVRPSSVTVLPRSILGFSGDSPILQNIAISKAPPCAGFLFRCELKGSNGALLGFIKGKVEAVRSDPTFEDRNDGWRFWYLAADGVKIPQS
jgi:hypothetical protein